MLLDGRPVRDAMLSRLRVAVQRAGSPAVTLATVVAADDRPSHVQVGYKHDAAAAVGLRTVGATLPGTASQAAVEETVCRVAQDPAVHGVFVQLPLPDGVDSGAVLDLVPVDKDVDGLGARSLGRLVRAEPGHAPAAARAVLRTLEHYRRDAPGQHAVVVGDSPFLARPLALLLARPPLAASVTLARPDTPGLDRLCLEADLLVSAADRPGLVTEALVREGATVVDAGVTRTPTGLVGDVDADEVLRRAGALVPSPGGLGPVTVACLLQATFEAAQALGAVPPARSDAGA